MKKDIEKPAVVTLDRHPYYGKVVIIRFDPGRELLWVGNPDENTKLWVIHRKHLHILNYEEYYKKIKNV